MSSRGRKKQENSPAPSPAGVSPLEAHLGFWLRFVSNHVSARFAHLMEANGVSVSEWVALRMLFAHRSVTPGALVEELGMTKGAISKVLGRLESKRLIERTAVLEDRRAQHLSLTALGQQLVPKLAAIADENDALFFGHLSRAAREDLVETLRELVRLHQLKDVPID